MDQRYRELPSVDRLLSQPAVQAIHGLPRMLLTALAREAIADARLSVGSGATVPELAQLADSVVEAARGIGRPSLRPLINATGVIIHTNLGRAPLSDEARAAMESVSAGYSNLEFDPETGDRGSRYAHLEELLRRVTGAEAGIAVNNNASALLLTLTALASGREVVISRSQAVEIGGGFRIPDVMRQSGALLVEVGTTNRTYLRDFEEAVGSDTAAFLRVHASNFRIRGFTTFPELAELTSAAHRRGLLLLDDLGSGCLLPVQQFGLAPEPTPQESLQAGADLALFSGDKLLGGPQAGIIVGRAELLRRLRAHPLARAVRLDKASIAGLAATLIHYVRGEALEKVPVWRMIAMPQGRVRERAERWASCFGPAVTTVQTRSVVGGGSLPDESLPSTALALTCVSPVDLARRLRLGLPPVVGRIERNSVLLDPRTVDPRDDDALVEAVAAALRPDSPA